MPRRIPCLLAILLAPALFAAASASQPALTTADLLKDGPYSPAVVDMVLHDAKRNKDLPVKIRYPKAAKGPLPVVIFSHGLGGSGDSFADLTEHWASRGYVVLLPTHADSIVLRLKNGQEIGGLLAARDTAAAAAALKSLVDPLDRLADLKLMLDQFDAIETEITGKTTGQPAAGHLLDRDRIAMTGHSLGALMTETLLGTKFTDAGNGGEFSLGDPRISCGILISGLGTATKALNKDSWSDIARPMLVITGSLDTEPISQETPQSRQEPFKFAKPGDKYLLYIDGATHGSYGGRLMSAVLLETPTTDAKVITDAVSAGTTAFLDAYLKKDDAAKAYLKTDALPKSSGGKATLDHK